MLNRRDGNTVTIVQTTDSSQVIGSQSVIVTVSGNETVPSVHRPHRAAPSHPQPNARQASANASDTEISVLAHL